MGQYNLRCHCEDPQGDVAISWTFTDLLLPGAARYFVMPAGGGTFLFRQESTQRGGLREALAPASEANP